MIDKILGFVGDIISPVTEMIDNLTTSKEEKLELKNKLMTIQNEMSMAVMKHEEETIKAQKEIIVAEINSGWLTRSWRPILMLSITAVVVNNYILYPYLSMFTDKALLLDLPDKLWNLMTVGVGGYVVSRGGEKIAEIIKKPQ